MSKVGNILFLTGIGLLLVCTLSLPFWKDFDSPLMIAVLGSLVLGALLIVAGETLRYKGRRAEKKMGLTFMEYYRLVKTKPRRGPSRPVSEGRRCSFCGQRLDPTGIPARLGDTIDLTRSEGHAGECEECGKLVCPQCAFRKGMEMGLQSFRCPSCGGRVL
jgi:hypothetical protein